MNSPLFVTGWEKIAVTLLIIVSLLICVFMLRRISTHLKQLRANPSRETVFSTWKNIVIK
ncbi:hypothetical protein P9D84_19625 [Bacillus vallismortis]|uniref:Uncharacterized protein n=1 Tax=Bacillus vallismortis TaxID=72361 RepID=A0AAP3FWQ5_BACVA|nr:hypothetical protein [Bacillus vallismortis]MEC1793550.1 hypothetical protein [Bacillus vallismortis]